MKNTITDDEYLAKWARHLVPGFRGVISRDQFAAAAEQLARGDSLVVNLDPGYSQGGTHWVGLRYSDCDYGDASGLFLYKDSFGAPPPEDIIRAVKARGEYIAFGTNINQKLNADNCGKLAVAWLALMAMSEQLTGLNDFSLFELLES